MPAIRRPTADGSEPTTDEIARERISDLKEAFGDAKKDMNEVKKDMKELDIEVRGLRGEVKSLELAVNAHKDASIASHKDLRSSVDGLKQTIEDVITSIKNTPVPTHHYEPHLPTPATAPTPAGPAVTVSVTGASSPAPGNSAAVEPKAESGFLTLLNDPVVKQAVISILSILFAGTLGGYFGGKTATPVETKQLVHEQAPVTPPKVSP
jgi:hypothetical protein